MLRRLTAPLVVLVVFATVVLAACGDGEAREGEQPTTTPPVATPTPDVPVSEPETGPTGIEAVDLVIAALEERDFDAFAALVILEPEPCIEPGQGAGGPPECEPGEAVGTLVDVVPGASCEGYWLREESLRQAFGPLLVADTRLYGVYHNDEKLFDREGAFSVIVEIVMPEGPMAANVYMTQAGVVGVNFGCGHTAEQMVALGEYVDPIFDPDRPTAGCIPGAADAQCALADQLAEAAANGEVETFRRLVDASRAEQITCEGNGLPFEATFLCEGATAGEVRFGFALARHGSEGGPITPAALKDMLAQYIGQGVERASTGCVVDSQCDTFLIAFATNSGEPRALYIALQRDGANGPYALVGAGLSGDNAELILEGGRTFTVAGPATFQAWGETD